MILPEGCKLEEISDEATLDSAEKSSLLEATSEETHADRMNQVVVPREFRQEPAPRRGRTRPQNPNQLALFASGV